MCWLTHKNGKRQPTVRMSVTLMHPGQKNKQAENNRLLACTEPVTGSGSDFWMTSTSENQQKGGNTDDGKTDDGTDVYDGHGRTSGLDRRGSVLDWCGGWDHRFLPMLTLKLVASICLIHGSGPVSSIHLICILRLVDWRSLIHTAVMVMRTCLIRILGLVDWLHLIHAQLMTIQRGRVLVTHTIRLAVWISRCSIRLICMVDADFVVVIITWIICLLIHSHWYSNQTHLSNWTLTHTHTNKHNAEPQQSPGPAVLSYDRCISGPIHCLQTGCYSLAMGRVSEWVSRV